MRQTLLYGESSGTGWEAASEYTSESIDKEIDSGGASAKGHGKMPRVSVPSPFARFELVQKAYANLANARSQSDTDERDRRLVSDSLDAWELFFENPQGLDTVRWHRRTSLAELKESGSAQQRLFGNALEMYLRQENYGFRPEQQYDGQGSGDGELELVFLTYHNDPVAVTSPVSVFMASPRPEMFDTPELAIDGGKRLFKEERPLWRRNAEFVRYVYRTLAWMKHLAHGTWIMEPLAGLEQYLTSQKALIHQSNPALYKEINTLGSEADPLGEYSRCDEVTVLGFPLYRRRREDAARQIQRESWFVIASRKSRKKPLVITNNFMGVNRPFTSKSTPWDREVHAIDYSQRYDKKSHYEFLKDYPDGWLYEHDFLSDALIELPYKLNERFFDGNLTGADDVSYLLPIKDSYFEYFDYKDLMGTDSGEKVLQMEARREGGEVKSVTVTLRIPVGREGGNTVVLKKTYLRASNTSEGLLTSVLDSREAKGTIVDYPLAVNIFPYVKCGSNNAYFFQLLEYNFDNSFVTGLQPVKSGGQSGADTVASAPALQEVRRSDQSVYYRLNGDFDYLRLKTTEKGGRGYDKTVESVIVPREIPEANEGTEALRFSFDFGTSNSHIAVRDSSGSYLNINLHETIATTLGRTSDRHAGSPAMQTFQTRAVREFLPIDGGLGSRYKFPMATVLGLSKSREAQSERLRALVHANLPFDYGHDLLDRNLYETKGNLKWDRRDKKHAEAYIEELVLLARGFAIEHGADLAECTFTWTYPVSMADDDVDEFNSIWERLYRQYFNPSAPQGTPKVKRITESLAPLLYYRDSDRLLSEMSLSIDIGGGTCDVVIFKDDRDQRLTSFRFGADYIFGVGRLDEVPMVKRALEEFSQKIGQGSPRDGKEEISKMLHSLAKGHGPAAEANRYLFGLETNPLLHNLETEDKSYNSWLATKEQYRFIFIYYYAALWYYLVTLMLERGYTEGPATVFMSGTGSKMLSIIGGRKYINKLTTLLIEGFSKGRFHYPQDQYVKVELSTEDPKTLTAKGALFEKGIVADIAERINEDSLPRYILRHSMSKTIEARENRDLLNGDLRDGRVISEITDRVKDFHREVTSLLDRNAEALRIDKASLRKISAYDSRLEKAMVTEINNNYPDILKAENADDNRIFHDSPFFFPIRWAISQQLKETEEK